jgi:hypothetical protein
MNEAFVEFVVLGRIPGTQATIGYKTSLLIAGLLILCISFYATLRYRHYVARKLAEFSPEKVIDLKTI